MSDYDYKFPKSAYKFTKRNNVPDVEFLKAKVRSKKLPKEIFYDFKGILNKFYPELNPKYASQYKEKELELIQSFGFTKQSFRVLINNTRTVFFHDIFRFNDMVKDRVKVVIKIELEKLEE